MIISEDWLRYVLHDLRWHKCFSKTDFLYFMKIRKILKRYWFFFVELSLTNSQLSPTILTESKSTFNLRIGKLQKRGLVFVMLHNNEYETFTKIKRKNSHPQSLLWVLSVTPRTLRVWNCNLSKVIWLPLYRNCQPFHRTMKNGFLDLFWLSWNQRIVRSQIYVSSTHIFHLFFSICPVFRSNVAKDSNNLSNNVFPLELSQVNYR